MANIDTYFLVARRPTILKDPDATLDYPFNWATWLAKVADTIIAVSWIIDASLTKVSSSFNTTSATAFVSGGVLGTIVPVTCRITTAGGRIDDRTIWLKIVVR